MLKTEVVRRRKVYSKCWSANVFSGFGFALKHWVAAPKILAKTEEVWNGFICSFDWFAGRSIKCPQNRSYGVCCMMQGYFLSFLLSFIWRPLNFKKLLPWAELNKDMLTGMRSMKRVQTLCSSATALLIIKWCLQKPGWTSFWKLLSRCWCAGDPPLKAGTLKPLTGMQDTE